MLIVLRKEFKDELFKLRFKKTDEGYYQSPVLYKKTGNGKISCWRITMCKFRFFTETWFYPNSIGAKVSAPTTCKGKNIGRINETNAREQAAVEAMAKYKLNLEKGYYLNVLDAQEKGPKRLIIEPMLAYNFCSEKTPWTPKLWVQPKLDGIRCLIYYDKETKKARLMSRQGKAFNSLTVIPKTFTDFYKARPELQHVIFDGELYNHQYKDNFNVLVSLVKKETPSTEADHKIQYHVFDMVEMKNNKMSLKTFRTRHTELSGLYNSSLKKLDNKVVLVETHLIQRHEIETYYAKFLNSKYEGMMLRIDGPYVTKRSRCLNKLKPSQECEFEIVDIEEGRGANAKMAGNAVLLTKDGNEFGANVIGPHSYCKMLLHDRGKVIGKKGTVIFQDYTPDGIPRFPRLKAIRDYEQ